MRIDPDIEVVGFRALQVRNALRKRVSVERELHRLVNRMTQVQKSNQFIDRVVRVWLFGSMPGDSPIVGDIDCT